MLKKNEFGFLGGPLPATIAAYKSGKDDFTGRTIMTPGASGSEQLYEIMRYGYDLSVPAWISSHGLFKKLYESIAETKNSSGEVKITPLQAASDITGFRPISVLEKGGTLSIQKDFQLRLREISTLKSKVLKDPNVISKASKLRELNTREKMVRTQMNNQLRQ